MTRKPTSSERARADRVVGWIERYCCHTKGEWAGRPLTLAPWQRDIVADIFGPADRSGARHVRTSLIGVPRKNGKSTLGAALALYLLIGDDEPGAEVYSVAADREQARIVFGIASEMVRAGKLAKYATARRNWIEVPRRQSIYRVLSADAPTKHGLNPHGVIFDELHAQPNRELWDVLTSGQGARRQPLTIAITTAGYDRDSICYEQYDYGRKVEAGIVQDRSFHFRWWGVQDAEQWDDPEVWQRVNPNFGVSVQPGFIESESKKAKHQPARQNAFRRLYLNEWTQASDRWLDLGAWDATAGMVDEHELAGRPCYGGLDLANTTDVAALAWDFPDGKGGHDAIWRFFVAGDQLPGLDRRTNGQASAWQRDGWLTVTEGNVIDYAAILAQIDRDAQRFDVRRLAFDRWGSAVFVQALADNGMEIAQMGQGFASMSPPTKELERLVLDQQYRHGGNPVMRWMVDNVVVRTDPAGNLKPDKQRSTEKIDGVVAGIMALDAATRATPKRVSAYETRGMEVVG
jgi:phage terminase large subunit-like protein